MLRSVVCHLHRPNNNIVVVTNPSFYYKSLGAVTHGNHVQPGGSLLHIRFQVPQPLLCRFPCYLQSRPSSSASISTSTTTTSPTTTSAVDRPIQHPTTAEHHHHNLLLHTHPTSSPNSSLKTLHHSHPEKPCHAHVDPHTIPSTKQEQKIPDWGNRFSFNAAMLSRTTGEIGIGNTKKVLGGEMETRDMDDQEGEATVSEAEREFLLGLHLRLAVWPSLW